jgi:4-hydroxy-3-methylbut-2-en-1-yl diphosphate reductase
VASISKHIKESLLGVTDQPHIRIFLVAPRGFCAGVQMAVDCLDRVVSNRTESIYAYHQIVHNNHVVASFRRKGVIFVDDLDQVPIGGTVVLSAHGAAPQVYQTARQRSLNVIDATCPLVTKVHLEARRFAAEGFSIVLLGHPGHDEVVGIEGEAGDSIQTIESCEDIDQLRITDPERVAVLTQTTLSIDETRATIAKLKSRFPNIRIPYREDVCYATQNRQEALQSVLPDCQLAFIIGSSTSSNSQRLNELSHHLGVASYLIEGPEQIKPEWLTGVHSLALTAGASVPEELVTAVLQWLAERFALMIEERIVKAETVNFVLPVSALSGASAIPLRAT